MASISSTSGINSLVSQFLALERRPVTSLESKKSTINRQIAVFTDLNTSLSKLEDKATDLADTTTSSIYNSKTTSSSETDTVTATTASGAGSGSYTFRVKQLATATSFKSTADLNTAAGTKSSPQVVDGATNNLDTTLSFANAGFDNTPDGTVTVNGQTFTLADYSTVDAFIDAINDNATAAANIYYDQDKDKFVIEADNGGASITISETGTVGFFTEVNISTGTFTTNSGAGVQTDVLLYKANFDTALASTDSGSFKINGTTITFDADEDTFNEVLSKINSSEAGVTAFYDNSLDRVVITSDTTGSEEIVFSDISGTFLSSVLKLSGVTQTTGQDALFTLNSTDSADEITKSSNTFEINGVTFTLKATNVTLYTDSSDATVTVSQDTAALESKIKSFLSQVNSTLNFIKAKSAVNADTSFRGVLAGNTTFRSLRRDVLDILTDDVSGASTGKPQNLGEIGITFDDDLQVSLSDTALLASELSEDSEAVELLFNSTNGVAARIEALLEPFTETNGIIDDIKDSSSDRIERIDTQIERLEERISRKEISFRRKFSQAQQSLNLILRQQSIVQSFLRFSENFTLSTF